MDVEDHFNGTRRDGLRACALDPIEGIRFMADAQAEGLRAASELLDRVLDREPAAPSPRNGGDDREYAPLLDAWASLLERFAAGLSRPGEGGAAHVSLDADGAGPALRIRWADGESSEAEIRLRNPGAEAVGPLSLRCDGLTAPDGTTLAGSEVRVAPGEIPELAAGSARALVVSLRAAGRPAPGVYRGTIQAAGAPRLWLPVEVTVERC